MTKYDKTKDLKNASRASDESFKGAPTSKEMDWLEGIWELQRIGNQRASTEVNLHLPSFPRDRDALKLPGF